MKKRHEGARRRPLLRPPSILLWSVGRIGERSGKEKKKGATTTTAV